MSSEGAAMRRRRLIWFMAVLLVGGYVHYSIKTAFFQLLFHFGEKNIFDPWGAFYAVYRCGCTGAFFSMNVVVYMGQ